MSTAPTALPLKCLHCAEPLQTPVVCQTCHSVQPLPPGVDHFALFGLPVGYEVDPADLHRRYLAVSRDIHPDVQDPAAPAAATALQVAAQVNLAYRTLHDPVRRMEYLLDVLGGPPASVEKAVAPPDLLGRVMMWREELEEARSARDEAALSALREQLARGRLAQLEQAAALARALRPDTPAEPRTQLRRLLNGLKYYDNLLAA